MSPKVRLPAKSFVTGRKDIYPVNPRSPDKAIRDYQGGLFFGEPLGGEVHGEALLNCTWFASGYSLLEYKLITALLSVNSLR
ncbi:MAG TPA: hypothetical protein VEI28_03590 [Thermodesulfovibrionales bacterium]|nr:hypothetical protein [Thermodesulfovibrionales bacterium]